MITLLKNIVGCMLVIGLFSCAKQSAPEPMPYFSEHEPYVSPFAEKKVQLIKDSYEGSASVSIVATVDNECLEKKYSGSSAKDDSLSSYFFHRPERNSKLSTQFFTFHLARQMTTDELASWADEDSCIIGVSDNHDYQIDNFNDTYYASNQRAYLDPMGFEGASELITPDELAAVKVAVIDTGVGLHDDLGGEFELPGVIHREDMRSAASKNHLDCPNVLYSNENPSNTHGTFVGGIIAAKPGNSIGITGLAPNAQIISLTVANCKGRIATGEIGNALVRALKLGAEVVNLSFGGSPNPDLAIEHAIRNLLNSKAVIVAAAGNKFQNLTLTPHYPASFSERYPGVIAVGWGTSDGKLYEGDRRTFGGNYSPKHVKIIAPGTSIISTLSGGIHAGYRKLSDPKFGIGSGSSFAAPMVTAAAAITIGYFKKAGLLFNQERVDYMLTVGASNKKANAELIRNGAVLDFLKLAIALETLKTVPQEPPPIAISNARVTFDPSSEDPILSFESKWNVPAAHFGARIGIFDLGPECNYSKPCLIQDFSLLEGQNEKSFRLSRNETLPLLSELKDPTFSLNLDIAIYYERKDASGVVLPIYGLDAVKKINLRDFDGSTDKSKFLGEVTNIRTDQQYLWIQGWTCFTGSNSAIPVSVIDVSRNTPMHTDFAYQYGLMFPHTPMDALGLTYGPFAASGINVPFIDKLSYLAGLEANAQIIKECKTLTTAHGFEFAIALNKIVTEGLQGKLFAVQATHPTQAGRVIRLSDIRSITQFKIPEVNFQSMIKSQVTVGRVSNGFNLQGNVCSQSPTPITMEISFSEWNLRCRLLNAPNFPNPSNQCHLDRKRMSIPYIYDSASQDRNKVSEYSFKSVHEPFFSETYDRGGTPEMAAYGLIKFPNWFPNTAILNGTVPGGNLGLFNSILKSKRFQNVDTGRYIEKLQQNDGILAEGGDGFTSKNQSFLENRRGSAVISGTGGFGSAFLDYWDVYDWGEPYTPTIVAYTINKSKSLGEYLFREFKVSKLMRENKKYETPIGARSNIVDFGTFVGPTSGGRVCPFSFRINKEVSDIINLRPQIRRIIKALLEVDQPDYDTVLLDRLEDAMRSVPLDIRFFQDGVMMLHLLSNYESRTFPVATFGRGGVHE